MAQPVQSGTEPNTARSHSSVLHCQVGFGSVSISGWVGAGLSSVDMAGSLTLSLTAFSSAWVGAETS
jgi:hypothetical protein